MRNTSIEQLIRDSLSVSVDIERPQSFCSDQDIVVRLLWDCDIIDESRVSLPENNHD